MTGYMVKQVGLGVIKLFLFLTVMFFFIQLMMPGDFVTQFSPFLNAAERANLQGALGLDQPIGMRYLNWMQSLLRGELGFSGFGFPVENLIRLTLPPTLLVFLPGMLIAFGLGLWFGARTIGRRASKLKGTTTLGGITLLSSFPPWLAWLVAYMFGRQASVSRGQGGINSLAYPNVDRMLWIGTDLRPPQVTSMMFGHVALVALIALLFAFLVRRFTRRRVPALIIIAAIIVIPLMIWASQGIFPYTTDLLRSAALPLLTFVLLSFGETMVIMQNSMKDVVKEPYVEAARAKGLPTNQVRDKHAARNALLPVLSRFFITLPFLLGGIVIIEDSLNWPGMGASMFGSLYWQDMPVVMGFLLVIGALSLFLRLGIDILAAYLDPRIRFDRDRSVPIN